MSKLECVESIKILQYLRDCLQLKDDFHTGVKAQWVMELNIMLKEIRAMDYTTLEKPKQNSTEQPINRKTLNILDLKALQ